MPALGNSACKANTELNRLKVGSAGRKYSGWFVGNQTGYALCNCSHEASRTFCEHAEKGKALDERIS